MKTHRAIVSCLLLLTLALLSGSALAAESEGVVNINEADEGQLALLPRVGPALAIRIIEHRKENGPFEAPEDLMLVRGIGEKTFAQMERYIAVSGATTLAKKIRTGQLEKPAPADG